jgi:hypothetical protein
MRSKLPQITACTPSNCVPLAAQSRDEPVPYSSPPNTTVGVPSAMYFMPASYIDICSPEGWNSVSPPSKRLPSGPGGIMRFLMRTLAKVPRIMIS